jgi:UDP-N-acetyl-D-galactosamine dehydrogenase
MMDHKRKVSVIGLGYVGLPVAVAFGKKSKTIGFDVSKRRISELKQGKDYTHEVTSIELKQADILYTHSPADLRHADFHIIAVPTPINLAKSPDLSAVILASKIAGSQLKKGDVVVYESTVYPGATEEECVPVLEKASGLKCGRDFFVGYSPERINPGDKQHTFTQITKVVSGQNKKTLDIVADVYGSVVTAGIHRAPSIRVAEAAKVIENTQRDLNIALMNELSIIFHKMDIDTHEVLAAAGTKWNFLPFTPGLVGGHCIGVDPYYLTYKAATLGYIPQVILAGRSINDGMGQFVAGSLIKALIREGYDLKNITVTILGVTFKENVPDIRNSRVIDIINELKNYHISAQIHDPVASPLETREEYNIDLVSQQELRPANAVILAVPHKEFLDGGWNKISGFLNKKRGLVFDVKSVLSRKSKPVGIRLYRL